MFKESFDKFRILGISFGILQGSCLATKIDGKYPLLIINLLPQKITLPKYI